MAKSRLPLVAALLTLSAASAAAPAGRYPFAGQDFDREVFQLLGWNNACSVSFAHYGFPYVGQALQDEPVMTRIGTLTLDPGAVEPKTRWALAAQGKFSWDARKAAKARDALRKEGYVRPGLLELMRPDPVVDDRDLPRLLLTTDTLKPSTVFSPPDEEGFRLTKIHYSPVDLCALMLYEKGAGKNTLYRPLLIRLGNPVSRADRALAHATNGLLLFERGDAPGALAETRIAAAMAPEFPVARYHYGGQLALSGATREALAELEAAVKLDPQYKEKARSDLDWDSLRRHPRFKDLTR